MAVYLLTVKLDPGNNANMNTQPLIESDAVPKGHLPDWLSQHLVPTHADFQQRVVCLPEHAIWQPTALEGVQMRVFEYVPGTRPRLAAQLRFTAAHSPATVHDNPGMELLIQRGKVCCEVGNYSAGTYFRLPAIDNPTLDLQRFSGTQDALGAAPLVYLAAGQMSLSDSEHRCIDTLDDEHWLPGPTDGTDVLPLHGHGTENVMMIRWNGKQAFKPRIDPQGEEILVLHGRVHDALGYYPAGSWIRNPVQTWQAWGAKAGTIVYYKNGHFSSATL